MPYRIRTDRPIADEIARVATEQIDRGLDEIAQAGRNDDATIYQLRKRCKKLRGLLKLVREPLLPGDLYGRENARLRNAARSLSGTRDAAVAVATFDALLARYRDQVDADALLPLRQLLVNRANARREQLSAQDALLVDMAATLRDARAAVDQWAGRVRDVDVLARGLTQTYTRGRKAMHRACREYSDPAFHEWRKQLKAYWYHCRLLQDFNPRWLRARRAEANRLAKLLGEAQDLSMLCERLSRAGLDPGLASARAVVISLAARRGDSVRRQAIRRGRCLYALPACEMT